MTTQPTTEVPTTPNPEKIAHNVEAASRLSSCISGLLSNTYVITLKEKFSKKMAAEIVVIAILIIAVFSTLVHGQISITILASVGVATQAWILYYAYLRDTNTPPKTEVPTAPSSKDTK